jgi:hypothetical protein
MLRKILAVGAVLVFFGIAQNAKAQAPAIAWDKGQPVGAPSE